MLAEIRNPVPDSRLSSNADGIACFKRFERAFSMEAPLVECLRLFRHPFPQQIPQPDQAAQEFR